MKVGKFKLFLENSSYGFQNDFIGRVVLKDFFQLNRVDFSDNSVVGWLKYSVLDDVVEVIEMSELEGDMVHLFRMELENMYPLYSVVGI